MEYIEREATEKMLENAQIISDGENCGYCTDDISISSIPSADVALVVRGKWILDRRIAGGAYFKCSLCGRKIEVNRYTKIESFPYCHCGAKMEGK